MLRMNGLRREDIVWVKDLDPVQKADMLLDGRIDVMLTSIQNYIGKFEGDCRVHVIASGDELDKYLGARPRGHAFVGVVSEETLNGEKETVERVTRVLTEAARLFSDDPGAWVDAASKRRRDVPKERIRKLWKIFEGDWAVNGGLGDVHLGDILGSHGATKGPGSTGLQPADRLLATEFERKALHELGPYPRAGSRHGPQRRCGLQEMAPWPGYSSIEVEFEPGSREFCEDFDPLDSLAY